MSSSLSSIALDRIRACDAEIEQRMAEERRQQEAACAAAEKAQRETCRKWLKQWLTDATVPDLPVDVNIRTLECEIEPFAQNVGDYKRIDKALQDLCKEEGLHSVQVTLPNGCGLISHVPYEEETDCCDGMGTHLATFIRDAWNGNDSATWRVRINIRT